jgi:hypothetical protein
MMFCLATLFNKLNAQAQQAPVDSLQSFVDTTGSYGFMYLSANCFECNPKGLVFYKKFIIISGFYKTKDFYSAAATRSVDHFRDKFKSLGYFIDKQVQTWKSPKLFSSFEEVKEYRDDLIQRLEKDNYKVVVMTDHINVDSLKAKE